MQALRLNEVLSRVVVWHNRHPLARRINASQVHSVGEVVLPFASATPPTVDDAGAGPALPAVADLLDPPAAYQADAAALRHDQTVESSAQTDASTNASADARMQTAADSAPHAAPAPDAKSNVRLDLAGDAEHPADPDRPSPRPPGADLSLPLEPPGWARCLLHRLAGLWPGASRLQAAFSLDFIPPLRPGRVARWARRHGQARPLAPTDWPRRVVDADPTRVAALSQKGARHAVALHLLTAAIGVDDRRLRVLMAPGGAIIGARAYSRPRLAAVATALSLALVAAGWRQLGPLLGVDADAPVAVASAASAASAAAATASAGTLATAPAASQSTDIVAAALAVAQVTPPAAPAATAATADAAGVAVVVAAAPDLPAPLPPARPDPGHAALVDAGPVAAPDTPPTMPPAATAAEAAADETHAIAPLGRIRPQLSVEQKQAARQQASALRRSATATASAQTPTTPRAPAVIAAMTVYAVVSPPSRQREQAASALALMGATGPRLPPPVPRQGDLIQRQGYWRAAWWPFVSRADAERARVMLAGRGLKAEVVEF